MPDRNWSPVHSWFAALNSLTPKLPNSKTQ